VRLLAVAVATTALLSATHARTQSVPPAAQSPLTIYFLHVGESDKPLSPFVLAAEAPSASDLARLLPEPLWRYASVFVLRAEDLLQVERFLRAAQPAQPPSHGQQAGAYGTFRVTLQHAEKQEQLVFPAGQSQVLFQTLFTHIAPSYPNWQAYLRNLLHRLGIHP
jgi:hypothetical protein